VLFGGILFAAHTDSPHLVHVPLAAGVVYDGTKGARLNDLDYYMWIPDHDPPSNLVINLDRGRHEYQTTSGECLVFLFNDQGNVYQASQRACAARVYSNMKQWGTKPQDMHNTLAEKLAGKVEGKRSSLTWYGNILAVKCRSGGRIMNLDEGHISEVLAVLSRCAFA